MKTIKGIFYTLLLAAVFISSCSKDKKSDIRDQATGNYNYSIKSYFLSAGEYTDTGIPYTGTFVIKKSDSDDKAIEFWESDKLYFEANNIEEADQGFTFNLPNQTISLTMSGFTIPLPTVGHNYFPINGTKHQGYYETSYKKINAALSASFLGTELVFQITGTKK